MLIHRSVKSWGKTSARIAGVVLQRSSGGEGLSLKSTCGIFWSRMRSFMVLVLDLSKMPQVLFLDLQRCYHVEIKRKISHARNLENAQSNE